VFRDDFGRALFSGMGMVRKPSLTQTGKQFESAGNPASRADRDPPPIGLETANPPEPAETQGLPLREVIQRYSEATGNQVRIKDDETFDQLYSVNDPSWLEDFNRMEILDEQTGKKEIILLGIRDGSGLKTKTAGKIYRQKFSRSSVPGVSGQAEVKQKRKGRVRSPFSRRNKK